MTSHIISLHSLALPCFRADLLCFAVLSYHRSMVNFASAEACPADCTNAREKILPTQGFDVETSDHNHVLLSTAIGYLPFPPNNQKKIPHIVSATTASSLSLKLSSPLTSIFSLSLFSISACNSASSFSVTAFGAIFVTHPPPLFLILLSISLIASSSVVIPVLFSRHWEVKTYRGGETSLTLTWVSGVFFASAHRRAFLTASMPS